MDAHLARQAPDIATSLATANKQYSALAPLKRLVGTTGDSGEFTTKQLARAIASNAKGSFVEGSAPQQAVLEALRAAEAGTAAQRAAGQAALAGAQGGTAIGGAIGKLANRADQGLELAALAYNPAVAAARYLGRKALAHAATSDNPALLRVLSGTTGLQRSVSDPVVRAYVARAVGGIAGGGSNSTL